MLYTRIVGLCTKKGIAIKRLEEELGLGEGSVGKWKKSAPSAYSLKRVADYFGTTVDELLRDDGEEVP